MMTEGEVAEGEEGVEEGEKGGRLDIIGDRPMTEPKTITVWTNKKKRHAFNFDNNPFIALSTL